MAGLGDTGLKNGKLWYGACFSTSLLDSLRDSDEDGSSGEDGGSDDDGGSGEQTATAT